MSADGSPSPGAVPREGPIASRPERRFPKSEWTQVCCEREPHKASIKSWFGAFLPPSWGDPLKAEILVDCETDREKKIRALFRRADGRLSEAVRTLGQRCTITMRLASPGILKDWREPDGALAPRAEPSTGPGIDQ